MCDATHFCVIQRGTVDPGVSGRFLIGMSVIEMQVLRDRIGCCGSTSAKFDQIGRRAVARRQ